MTWRIVLEQDTETGEYAVWCPELPGCVSAGATEEEARSNIREAIQLFLEETPLEPNPRARIDRMAV
ncbi:MAG: type II toxin-antitoxin system HicB family antitoxin [Armatimonadetes bacterium]|nr:type II toxin-antitoxin system HicB family antitoxin [Armatimonadota bacterium]